MRSGTKATESTLRETIMAMRRTERAREKEIERLIIELVDTRAELNKVKKRTGRAA